MLPPFQFYKDQGVSHCSCPRTVQPERNSVGEEQAFCALGMLPQDSEDSLGTEGEFQ